MIEQNVYSRSRAEHLNAMGQKISLGYGSIGWSPGLTDHLGSLNKWVSDYKNEYAVGGELPTIRQKLLTQSGLFALQANTHIRQDGRFAHIAHQFCIIDPHEQFELLKNPADMFGVRFVTEEVTDSAFSVDVLAALPKEKPFEPRPLKTALDAFGLNKESFLQLIVALFDTLNIKRRQVLIGYDPSKEGAWEDCQQLLYHIHCLMPLGTRRAIGYDSLFNAGTSPDPYNLSFVPCECIEASGNGCFVRVKGKDAINMAYSYVFQNGRIHHSVSPKVEEKFRKRGVFTDRLEELIEGALYPEDQQALCATERANQSMIELCERMNLQNPLALSLNTYELILCIRSGREIPADLADNLISLAQILKGMEFEDYERQIAERLSKKSADESMSPGALSELVAFAGGDYGEEAKRVAEDKLLDQFRYRLDAQGYEQAMSLGENIPGELFERMMARVYADKSQIDLLLGRRTQDIILCGEKLTLSELISRWEAALKLEGMGKDSPHRDFAEGTVARTALSVSRMLLGDDKLQVNVQDLKAFITWPDELSADNAAKVELYDPFATELQNALKESAMEPVRMGELDALIEMRKEPRYMLNHGTALMAAYYDYLCWGIADNPEVIEAREDTLENWVLKAKEAECYRSDGYSAVRKVILQAYYLAMVDKKDEPGMVTLEWLDRAPALAGIDPDDEAAWIIAMARAIYKNKDSKGRPLGCDAIMKDLSEHSVALKELYQRKNTRPQKIYDHAVDMLAAGMEKSGYQLGDHYTAAYEVLRSCPENAERVARMMCTQTNLKELPGFLRGRLKDVLTGDSAFIECLTRELCQLQDGDFARELMGDVLRELDGFRQKNRSRSYDFLDTCMGQLDERLSRKQKGGGLKGFFGWPGKDRK